MDFSSASVGINELQRNHLWAITSIVGAALCLLVLLVVALVWLNASSRGTLDRVSFRIAVYVVFCK